MKKFDLYEIAIKILGLYLVVNVIEQLSTILTFIPMTFMQDSDTGGFNEIPVFLVMAFGLIVLIVFAWLLIFRTQQITKLITKPTDKEENVKLFAERKTIYEICLVLLGLIIIVWTLPDFIVKLRNYVTFVQNNTPVKLYDKTFLLTSGAKIIVGVLAIVYSTQLADIMTKKKNIERKPQN